MSYLFPIPEGVLTASLTPLMDDLTVDLPALISHCKWLLNNGSNGLALLGTTGEANSFSLSERMAVAEAIAKSGLTTEKIMLGTGCCALPDSITLTKQAVDLGYGGVLLLPPFYYKQLTEEGMLRYFDQLIRGVQNDNLHIYLYHILN